MARRLAERSRPGVPLNPLRVVIFAKAPRSGFAKTRLIPALGAHAAADLARRLLTHTVCEAMAAEIGAAELCATPSVADEGWPAEVKAADVLWTEQGEGHLGDRLARAARRVIDSGESVLFRGTDCPELRAAHLQKAARSLRRFDATMFPTADGGYALLGLNRFDRSLFSNIAWSTNTVARETVRRLSRLNWRVEGHTVLHDIDEPADLQWLPKTWAKSLPPYAAL